MIYVTWERPRHWRVRLYQPSSRTVTGRSLGGHHETVGIVALSVDRAIAEAQRLYPDYRIESCHDCGEITAVADNPTIEVRA